MCKVAITKLLLLTSKNYKATAPKQQLQSNSSKAKTQRIIAPYFLLAKQTKSCDQRELLRTTKLCKLPSTTKLCRLLRWQSKIATNLLTFVNRLLRAQHNKVVSGCASFASATEGRLAIALLLLPTSKKKKLSHLKL